MRRLLLLFVVTLSIQRVSAYPVIFKVMAAEKKLIRYFLERYFSSMYCNELNLFFNCFLSHLNDDYGFDKLKSFNHTELLLCIHMKYP